MVLKLSTTLAGIVVTFIRQEYFVQLFTATFLESFVRVVTRGWCGWAWRELIIADIIANSIMSKRNSSYLKEPEKVASHFVELFIQGKRSRALFFPDAAAAGEADCLAANPSYQRSNSDSDIHM